MKIRDKLKLSFWIMVILPVALFCIVVACIYSLQQESIKKAYDINDDAFLLGAHSPIITYGRITDSIYKEMQRDSENNPESFGDEEYLNDITDRLSNKLSALVVAKNSRIIFNSTKYNSRQLEDILPQYSDTGKNIQDAGTYKGGDYQCLIKQLDFEDENGNVYNVSIVTSLKEILPQMKEFGFEVGLSIILILIVTSFILNMWIYSSILKPLNKLKLATNNITEGNLDFEMPKISNDEIGEVCKDFENMRRILKYTSEQKIKSDAEEKELIRNISHDLKTPITAIRGYVEGLLDGVADTPEKQERYIKTIANKVNDMDRLIEELTIYSRLDTNRIPYSFVRCSVSEYFADCCEEIGIELETRQIELSYRNHLTEPVFIYIDPEQIKRVVNNIISNSVKYMKDGVKGEISIDVYDEGDYVHIIFKDNGIGIAAKDINRIFERFYRTDESRNSKKGGSGIGLAIVKMIVEDHKGKIWAESVEGEGTTMHLNLLKDFKI